MANRLGKRIVLLLIATIAAAVAPCAFSQSYDAGHQNGRVIDPESKLDGVRNVAVRNGKIAAISKQPLSGKSVIDAKGLVRGAGIIDLHSHAVLTLAGAACRLPTALRPRSNWRVECSPSRAPTTSWHMKNGRELRILGVLGVCACAGRARHARRNVHAGRLGCRLAAEQIGMGTSRRRQRDKS